MSRAPRPVLDLRGVTLPSGWPGFVQSAVLHTIMLATLALTEARAWCENSRHACVRWAADKDRLLARIRQLEDELAIKDARMARLAPAKRPQYSPTERLEILEIRAARAWNAAQIAECFHVNEQTIANWMHRLDESGEGALVQLKVPINKYPDYVRYLVQKLFVVGPRMGRRRIAAILARAGLHLGASTVRRMLIGPVRPAPEPFGGAEPNRRPAPPASPTCAQVRRVVKARYTDHLWHIDLTTVHTLFGFWAPWLPYVLPQTWPFRWQILVVIDHSSRSVVGFDVFTKEASTEQVCAALDRCIGNGRGPPRHMISDQGTQFREHYELWCARNDVKPRFGALHQHGSIAIVERFIRTLKSEGLRRDLTPLGIGAMRQRLGSFADWYDEHRPHSALRGATPAEIRDGKTPARDLPRLEPRMRYPVRGEIRGNRGDDIEMVVTRHDGRPHLPVVQLRPIKPRRAA